MPNLSNEKKVFDQYRREKKQYKAWASKWMIWVYAGAFFQMLITLGGVWLLPIPFHFHWAIASSFSGGIVLVTLIILLSKERKFSDFDRYKLSQKYHPSSED